MSNEPVPKLGFLPNTRRAEGPVMVSVSPYELAVTKNCPTVSKDIFCSGPTRFLNVLRLHAS